MPKACYFLVLVVIGAVLASCAPELDGFTIDPRLAENVTLTPDSYGRLSGWSEDSVAAALPAFLSSCRRLPAQQPDNAPLDPVARAADYGRLRDWRPLCLAAAGVPRGDEQAARRFFEANFVPVQVSSKNGAAAVVTGYWEVDLSGSRHETDRFRAPVYRRPADLVDGRPYLERAAIEDGALAGKGLEIAWLESPDDVLVLQTQGSGRIHLPDGSVMRLAYEGNNSRKAVDVSRLLVDQGAIPRERLSGEAVRTWMRDNPQQAKTLRRKIPLYVFFRELKGDGPVGYQGTVLTAERSLAVDHNYIPLGVPLWLEAQDKFRPVAVKRLVVAQDIGDGIEGPLRGDFYWGSGQPAAARGGNFYADGRYWLLLPRRVAARLAPPK